MATTAFGGGMYGEMVGKSSFNDSSLSVNQMIMALPGVDSIIGWKDIPFEKSLIEVVGVAKLEKDLKDDDFYMTFHFMLDIESENWVIIGFGMTQVHKNHRIYWICNPKEDPKEFEALFAYFRKVDGESFMKNMVQLHLIRLDTKNVFIEELN